MRRRRKTFESLSSSHEERREAFRRGRIAQPCPFHSADVIVADPMTTRLDTDMKAGSGRFLVGDTTADAVFTREDLSEEQLLFGRAAEEFMRTEVVPRAAEIYAKNWPLTRELIKKAADRDFTRLEIPEAYGGLGLDKVSTACVGEQLGLLPSFAGSRGAHIRIGPLA